MSCLFVGGLRDGEWFSVPDAYNQWNVRERLKPVQIRFPLPESIEPSYIRQMMYSRMKFTGLKDTYSIFAAPGLTPDDVLERLITEYRPTVSEEASHES